MNLKNNILPSHILRRIKMYDISNKMKANSLRVKNKGVSLDKTIWSGAELTSKEIIPWQDEDGRDYDEKDYLNWVKTLSFYLRKNYGKENEEYLQKVLPDDSFILGNKYIFWKHSERNGGNGFSESFKTWGDLILKFGWWFPLNWWEIKSKLDNINDGRVLILNPDDKYNNTGYYFSVIKEKLNVNESRISNQIKRRVIFLKTSSNNYHKS